MKIGFPKIKRTKVVYFLDNICEFISNIVFLTQTFFICLEFGFLYAINYDEEIRFENFIKQLASLNIFYVKLFQSICTNNYLLNDMQIEYLLKYTDEVPFSSNEIDISIERSLDTTALRISDNLEINKHGEYLYPYKSGMISLIYRGTLNGEKVIIKVLRKNIKNRLRFALKRMNFLFKLIGYLPYIKTFQLNELIKENKAILMSQTNFNNEVENINKMYSNCLNTDYVKIPKVYPEYTNDNSSVIVMEFLDGCKLEELDENDKDIYCEQLAKFSVKCILYNRLYHADLHPGNILFIKENGKHKLGIIDFGIMGELTKNEQNYYFKLLTSIANTKDYEDVIDIFLDGLVEPREKIKELSKTRYQILRSELANILNNKQTNYITSCDVFKINTILGKYNLFLSKNFCKVELCMAISDSVISKLSCNKSYLDYMKENVLSVFNTNGIM
jgi:ubiquinone biosynthesis protein